MGTSSSCPSVACVRELSIEFELQRKPSRPVACINLAELKIIKDGASILTEKPLWLRLASCFHWNTAMALSSFASTIKSVIKFQSKLENNPSLGTEGLTSIELLALCLMASGEKQNQLELGRSLGLRRKQTDRFVADLQKRGYVGPSPKSEEDPLVLTAEGKTLHEHLEKTWDTWIAKNPESRTALAGIRQGVRGMQTSLAAS